jgi:uncharacterized protein (DUF58 family)
MDLKDLFSRIHRVEITTRSITKQLFSGQYQSAFKGRGMSFSEVRDYSIGDDVRSIDWNVTARFDAPFVKVFEEERELVVMLLIDVSASMDFGSGQNNKETTALEVAATLIFSALATNDRVGAILFSDRVEKFIKPNKGRHHGMHILKELMTHKPQSSQTSIEEALHFFRGVMKRSSVAFVLSDFQTDEDFSNALKITKKRHDLIAIQISDRAESELPDLGLVDVENLESGRSGWLWLGNKKKREKIALNLKKQQTKIEEQLHKSRVDYTHLYTNEPIVKPLIYLFQSRYKK